MIKPLGENIAIRMIEESTITPSGIFFSKSPEDRPQEAFVVAVGPGKVDRHGKRILLTIKENEHILFAKYGVVKKTVNNVEYGFIKEEAILGVLLDYGTKFKPFGDHIVVGKIHETDISPGGIIVSLRKTNEIHVWADVVEVSANCRFIKPGYSIYFPKLLAWQLEDNRMLVKQEIVLCAEDNS